LVKGLLRGYARGFCWGKIGVAAGDSGPARGHGERRVVGQVRLRCLLADGYVVFVFGGGVRFFVGG